MFRGRSVHTIDAKNRISIPAGYRVEFERRSDRELKHPESGVEYYIVIDTQHGYTKDDYANVRKPSDLTKLGDSAQSWAVEKIVRDDDGTVYFVVLKRKAQNPMSQ